MTPKYIQNEINLLQSLKAGMITNAAKWTGQPVDTADIDAAIAILVAQAAALETAQHNLSILQETIHGIVDTQIVLSDQTETLARGIHAKEPEKLNDYDIKHGTAVKVPLPVPGKANIIRITDDADGEGFVLEFSSLANCSDFEIWRGTSATPDLLVLSPDNFKYLTTTKKLSFIDNAVVKGTRYFYMIRGFNRTGKGEWSPTVSRVQ